MTGPDYSGRGWTFFCGGLRLQRHYSRQRTGCEGLSMTNLSAMRNLRLRTSSIVLLLGVASLAIAFGLILARTFVVQHKAGQFLTDVEAMRVGKSSFPDLLSLEQNYAEFSGRDSSGCTEERCTIYFSFDNRWLYRAKLAPGARFGGGITVTHNVVSEIELDLFSNPAISANVKERSDMQENDSSPYVVHGRSSGDRIITLNISLAPGAPEEERRRAYSFNLSCLSQFQGCSDSRMMLPQVILDPPR